MVGLVRFLTLLSEVDPRRLQGVPHLTETGEVVGDEKLRAVEDGEHENPSWFSNRRGSFAVCGRRPSFTWTDQPARLDRAGSQTRTRLSPAGGN